MAKLTICGDDPIMAFGDQGLELRHFFDCRTGEVLAELVMGKLRI